MMSDREKFIVLVDNDSLKPADAVVLLEGDGTHRIAQCVQLLRAGWAPRIVISGGVDQPAMGCTPAHALRDAILAQGITEGELVLEPDSLHTRDQAENIMQLARAKGWSRLILVASNYHQYRAYLTFLKAMREASLSLEILNAPARDLRWFEATGWGERFTLLEREFTKIETYAALGHLATFADAIAYQRWKECQPGS